ncbi:iron uptake porin [Nostoc sp.]|uniref:iron uptake porin n=1 Tax=Nostoc sp. TaxID=1180 RepID=UPI002FFA9BEB
MINYVHIQKVTLLKFNFLTVTPGVVSAVVISIGVLTPFASVKAEESEKNTDSFEQVSQYTQQDSTSITSVSRLSDVQPTDWAFGALQSLAERYRCITGYPDGSFKGDRPITRFEFATALNACLDKIHQNIAGVTDIVTRGDLATLQKLQEEFTPELATLRGRIDDLEVRTPKLLERLEQLKKNELPRNHLKVSGELIFATVDAFGYTSRSGNGDDNNLTFSSRARINFDRSFTGKDRLRVRFQASNVINPIAPGNDSRLSFVSGSNTNNEISVSKLEYSFPVGKKLKILIATGFNTYFDDWDVINRLRSDANGTPFRGLRYSHIYRLGGDTGIGVTYKLNRNLKLELAYLAKNTNNPASGLFNGGYGALGQIVFYPNGMCQKDKKKEDQNQKEKNKECKINEDKVNKIAITYVNAYNEDGLGHNTGSFPSNLLGRKVSSDSFGIETNVIISDGFQLGGWLAYTNARALTGEVKGDADIWSWAVTLAFPDLGKTGNLGGIIMGMQPKLTGTSAPLSGDLPRRDPDTGFHIEGFYQYKISENISITPALLWLTAPNHDEQNGDIFLGVVRTTFTF